MALDTELEKIPALLHEKCERYRVPGASLAVLRGDESFETATGVVNLKSGVEATPDAVFQIGSITKLFTATLVMQLVDEGRVELDAPLRDVLPELELGDGDAARQVTVRHLLTHTSGIDGDFFQDTGRGDDCVERYVLACSGLGQLHVPGTHFSYCNSGFVLAGRVVEKLRGMTWDAALRRYLLDPIGAESMVTLPEDTLFYRAALGHLMDPDGEGPRVPPTAYLPRSNGPAGATPYAAARDLLAFARMHLRGGVGPDGERVLSEASVRSMQEWQTDVPQSRMADGWGLGWMLFDWSGQRVIGHDGGTIGQNSYFRMIPDQGVAVALLTNGGNPAALHRSVFGAVLGELAGVSLPDLPGPQSVVITPERYVGTYERLQARVEVTAEDGELHMRAIERRSLLPGPAETTAELHPVNDALFCWTAPGSSFRNYVTFVDFDDEGRAGYLFQGRLARRVR
jgi:CubicO group peptidase (beta-lactamase class C family)